MSAETVVHSKLGRCVNVTKGRVQNWPGARMIALGEIFTPDRSGSGRLKPRACPNGRGASGSARSLRPSRNPPDWRAVGSRCRAPESRYPVGVGADGGAELGQQLCRVRQVVEV